MSKKKKTRKNRKTLQACPRCGDDHQITLVRQGYPKSWKKYRYQCGFCRFNTDGPMYATRRGARKHWNRLTNIIWLGDILHEGADL